MPEPLSVPALQVKVCVVSVLVDPFGVLNVGTPGAVPSIRIVWLLAHDEPLVATSLDIAVQYHNPSDSVIVALVFTVTELYTGPLKLDDVDTRTVWFRMPEPVSAPALQLKVCVVTVLVDPFGVLNVGTPGATLSIRTVRLVAHAEPLVATSLDIAVQYHKPSLSVSVALVFTVTDE